MSFQWNTSGPNSHATGRTQPASHWSNQDQYTACSISTSHFMYQESGGLSSNNWNTGVSYNQWCPPASQEQMNWTSTYPSNPYNQVMSGSFVPDRYSSYTHQSKTNYGENFTGLYNETKRNNSFNYQATNSFMSGQGNNYGMLENTLMNNCQEPVKACGNQNTNSSFPYWNPNSNGSQTMNYMAQPIYNNHICEDRPSVNLKMKSEMESNHTQQAEGVQSCEKKNDVTLHRPISKSDAAKPSFSDPASANYFVATMSGENVPSSMSPDHENVKSQNLFNSLCLVNSHKAITSTLSTSNAVNSSFISAKFNETVNSSLMPTKFNDTVNSPLMSAHFNNTVNSSLISTKFNDSVNLSLMSAKFNDTVKSSLTSAKFSDTVNSSLTSTKFNDSANASLMSEKFNDTVKLSLTSAKLNDTVNSSLISPMFIDSVNSSLMSTKFDSVNLSLTSAKLSNAANSSLMSTKFDSMNSSLTSAKFSDTANSSLISREYNDSINSSRHDEHNDTNTGSKEMFTFMNNHSSDSDMTTLMEKDDSTKDFQRKISSLESRIQAKSSEFEKAKKLEGSSDEKCNVIMYHLSRGLKILELELEKIESEVKEKTMTHNLPLYIGLEQCGSTGRDEHGLPDHTDITLKSMRQHLSRIKDQISQHFSLTTKSDTTALGSCQSKIKKIEDHTSTVVASKTNSVKQARRAVLKYLLKLSGQIENCFSELRNVKRILKDDPNDKNVMRILHTVGLHINQSRLSLKEKKKLCAKSNIRLRSLTIKSTGTNILQTLESDIYHLRRFYTALSHIARHLGTVEKSSPGQNDSAGEEVTKASSDIHLDSFTKDGAADNKETDTDILISENSQSVDHPMKIKSSTNKSTPSYSANKSSRFIFLERSFWTKLMELSYNIRAKILALRQAERAYKNGVKGSLSVLCTQCEIPCKSFKRDFKLLAHWKKKYSFSRHIPTYILQSYPEQERRSRDKITMKSVRNTLATFMSLCYSTRVSIGTETSYPDDSKAVNSMMKQENSKAVNSMMKEEVSKTVNNTMKEEDSKALNSMMKEEARFWKRLIVLKQKIHICQLELSKFQQGLSLDGQDKKNIDSFIIIEAKVKEIEHEMEKEIVNKQKNGFSDVMPLNAETERLKLTSDECRDIHLLRRYFQTLKSILSQIKSTRAIPSSNPELSSTVNCQKQKDMTLQIQEQKLPSHLANFLGDGASGWI